MSEIEMAVVEQMERRGGSFVQALAKAFRHADPDNFIRLLLAFPEYWERYRGYAEIDLRAKKGFTS